MSQHSQGFWNLFAGLLRLMANLGCWLVILGGVATVGMLVWRLVAWVWAP